MDIFHRKTAALQKKRGDDGYMAFIGGRDLVVTDAQGRVLR